MKDMHAKISRKVLVTGGGGFLGSAICRKLIAQGGQQVHSFCRRFYPELASMGVRQIQGDIRDRLAVEKATRHMDVVYHTAARAGIWGNESDYHAINVIGTRNVLSACLSNRISALVHTSSPSVVFDGSDMEGINESAPYPARFHAPYPRTKAIAEKDVRKAAGQGLHAIILRPHLIWGPNDPHLIPRIIGRANKLVKVGHKDKRVDTIYVDNAADAHILAADALQRHPEFSGRIYFISQDDPINLWDMINAILDTAGLEPIRRTAPYRPVWLAGILAERIYKGFDLSGEPPMTRFVAEELATAHWFDISAAKQDLGYVPRISIPEGLERVRSWLKTARLVRQ